MPPMITAHKQRSPHWTAGPVVAYEICRAHWDIVSRGRFGTFERTSASGRPLSAMCRSVQSRPGKVWSAPERVSIFAGAGTGAHRTPMFVPLLRSRGCRRGAQRCAAAFLQQVLCQHPSRGTTAAWHAAIMSVRDPPLDPHAVDVLLTFATDGNGISARQPTQVLSRPRTLPHPCSLLVLRSTLYCSSGWTTTPSTHCYTTSSSRYVALRLR